MARLKVLLSAYDCLPGVGSEAGTSWEFAQIAARENDVWVLTRTDYRSGIEAELARNPIPNLHFVYVSLPAWVRALQVNPQFSQTTYYIWQVLVVGHARRLHREVGLDVAHHIALQKYWMPSFLWRLPVPLIWGPVGGGESAPLAFWPGFSLRGKIYEILRSSARWLGECDPFLKLAARRSALILATSEQSRERLERLGSRRLSTYPGIGLLKAEIDRLASGPARESSPVRFLSIGRALHWKGFHLGLQAFAKACPPGAEYWVMGDGPELGRLKDLARTLGIAERVVFLGRLPRDQVLDRLRECDVLVHPSLHESGGICCLEAMAARMPVICLDLGGPAIQVSKEAGFRASVQDPERTIAEIADAMTRLAGDADLRRRMGEAGHQRVVQNYDWERKLKLYHSLYRKIASAKEKGSDLQLDLELFQATSVAP